MGSLFGKRKKVESKVTEYDKSILQMKSQRDKIRQYQRRIEQNLGRDRDLARQLLRDGKKERAKLLLRKKRYQEQLLEKTDSHLENIEKMIHDVEFSQIEMQVMDGLKSGNEALKKIHEVLTVDEVERILEETREGVEKQKEIDELLSGVLTEEDEAAVEEELEALVGPTLPEVPTELPEVPTELPEVPVHLPGDGLKDTDRERRPAKERERQREKVALEAA